MCQGGLDLRPTIISCGYGRFIFGIISFKTTLLLFGAFGILYYMWPFVEKVLLVLPIPDPSTIKEKFSSFVASTTSAMSKKNPKHDYEKGFDRAPESLEEEDDEDDVGKPMNNGKGSKSGLNFDSDEDRDGSELISLDNDGNRDRTGTAANSIPKLQKPLQ